MSETPRSHLAAEQKVAAVKRHLLDHVPVSQICDELHISVNSFYLWQKELFENGHRASRRTAVTPPAPRRNARNGSTPSKLGCNARTASSPVSWKSTSI